MKTYTDTGMVTTGTEAPGRLLMSTMNCHSSSTCSEGHTGTVHDIEIVTTQFIEID